MVQNDKNNINITKDFIDKLIDKLSKIIKEQHALSERDDEQEESIELLLEKVSLIEKNYEELVKSLAQGSYPLKLAKSIEITESLTPVKIVPVELTKSQLIETYNEIPMLLAGYIIPITLTADSYRNLNPNEIILETTVKGNYWAITILENKQHQYWLVPNSNLKFDLHKLKTINSLFQLTGNYESPSSEYFLQEPAILTLLPNNRQWKLLQPGVLFFSDNLKPEYSQGKGSQDQINSSTWSTLQTTIEKLNNKIIYLENQANVFQSAYQKERAEWLAEKKVLNKQLQQTVNYQSQSANLINQAHLIEKLNNQLNQLEIQSKNFQKTYQREREEWLAEKQTLNEQIQKTVNSQSQLANLINQDNLAETFNFNNNLQQNLNQLDLELVKSLKLFFQNMVDIVRRYHSDHHASKEEAEIIVSYLLKASQIIDNTKTDRDLIKLFEYIVALKGKVSQHNHNEHKYRWSVILENEVLSKLQKISILQIYQSKKLERLIIQQALNEQVSKLSSESWQLEEKEKIEFNSESQARVKNNQNEKIDLKNKISQFKQVYNQDQKLLLNRIIAKVAITVETLEQISFHTPDKIVLENTPHGKYWIINFSGSYFLILSQVSQITEAKETSLTVAKILFDLSGYYKDYSQCELIKPAIVTKLSNNQWQLQEKGKVNFY